MHKQTLAAAIALLLAGAASNTQAIALLDGYGGARDYGQLAMSRNDDGSSNQIALPFDINFFGNPYSNFFINNNGNISFTNGISGYTPTPFPVASQPMIAPFWGDVDTSNDPGDDSNNVWVASPNSETTVVTWDRVGYYSGHNSPTNDFQLVLRDREADTGNSGDFDIEFRYNELNWTTGDASGGTGGQGGTPAQAGYDAGNNTDYFVLPGSRTASVVDLQDTSNVSAATPGLWSFSIREGTVPGETPDNPLLPIVTDEGWDFEFGVVLGQTVFIDPIVAIGYDYIVNSGPLIQTVTLPSVGDDIFELLLWSGVDWVADSTLNAGVEHIFATAVDRFRIQGIETGAALDPNDTTAFVTGLTFASAGTVNMSQIPITFDTDNTGGTVPEPATIALMGLGLAGLGFRKKKQA